MTRTLLLLIALAACGARASAAVIADRDAGRHVGQSATVEGVVTGTHVSARGTAFLDFGARYPDEDFTVVIFARTAGAFGDIGSYYGKRVDITGRIELYRGRPEIIVRFPSQLRVAH